MKYFFIVLAVCMSTTCVKAETASWYGAELQGRKTANGERFNRHAYTAAHRSLPFNSRITVCRNRKCVTVRINDRGPFVKGRSIDLSEAAAKKIGCKGICRVTIRRSK